MEHDTNAPKISSLKRRKAWLAGTVGLALLGLSVGEGFLPNAMPALAQNQSQETPITTSTAPASFSAVVKKVNPAVVSVRVRGGGETQLSRMDGPSQMMPNLPDGHPLERFFREFGERGGRFGQPEQQQRRGMAQGSGFFISADGYVVTNNHVVDKGDEIEVTLDDGSSFPAKVVGTDEKTDLALLKVDADREFPYVEFASADPDVGDWTVAIGNPFGLGGSVTAGIISARGRDIGAGPYDDFIQIDAPINRGNSGGPAFNLKGEVIGVNTAIFSPSGGSVGIGFAIPAEVASNVVTALREDGEVTRGWLGVSIQPVSDDMADALGLDEAHGAIVAEPQPDSPAAEAGIRSGDVIVGLNGDEIEDARDLSRKVALLDPDTTAEFEIVRDGRERTVEVEIGRMKDEPQQQASRGDDRQSGEDGTSVDGLGLALAPASSVAGAGEEGVVVTNVDPNGAAAEKGLQAGDVILEVGGKAVERVSDVTAALDDARESDRNAVLMRVKSDERTRFVAVTLPNDRG